MCGTRAGTVHKKAVKESLVSSHVFFLSDPPHVLIRVLTGQAEDQGVQGFLPQDVTCDPSSLVTDLTL